MKTVGAIALLGLASAAGPVFAMGYDSLDCPELAERRIAYFTNNGYCDPAKPADAKAACSPIAPGAEAGLPEADRTQVLMILRTEERKKCPAK